MLFRSPATGKRGYWKPTAHGNEFEPFESDKPQKPVFTWKDIANAKEMMVNEIARSRFGEKNPDGSIKTVEQIARDIKPPTGEEAAKWLHQHHQDAETANGLGAQGSAPPQNPPGNQSPPAHEPLPSGVAVNGANLPSGLAPTQIGRAHV